jgi:hypothetical protein
LKGGVRERLYLRLNGRGDGPRWNGDIDRLRLTGEGEPVLNLCRDRDLDNENGDLEKDLERERVHFLRGFDQLRDRLIRSLDQLRDRERRSLERLLDLENRGFERLLEREKRRFEPLREREKDLGLALFGVHDLERDNDLDRESGRRRPLDLDLDRELGRERGRRLKDLVPERDLENLERDLDLGLALERDLDRLNDFVRDLFFFLGDLVYDRDLDLQKSNKVLKLPHSTKIAC